jgi:hypothetical protein
MLIVAVLAGLLCLMARVHHLEAILDQPVINRESTASLVLRGPVVGHFELVLRVGFRVAEQL